MKHAPKRNSTQIKTQQEKEEISARENFIKMLNHSTSKKLNKFQEKNQSKAKNKNKIFQKGRFRKNLQTFKKKIEHFAGEVMDTTKETINSIQHQTDKIFNKNATPNKEREKKPIFKKLQRKKKQSFSNSKKNTPNSNIPFGIDTNPYKEK
jgi:hypothetical protein